MHFSQMPPKLYAVVCMIEQHQNSPGVLVTGNHGTPQELDLAT